MSDNGRQPVASPCISLCELDTEMVCKGCFRRIDDIASWRAMDNKERLDAIDRADKRRLKSHPQ